MFLSELIDEERKTFLDLAYQAIGSDGVVDEREEAVFKSYAYECEMVEYQPSKSELKDLICSARSYTKKIRRIIIMELYGILFSDGKLCEKEDKWIENLATEFEFSPTQARRLKRWSKDFIDVIEDGYRLVESE